MFHHGHALLWVGRWRRGAAEGVQIFDLQRWKQVRGLEGAVMCETRDLGCSMAQWHTSFFESRWRWSWERSARRMCRRCYWNQPGWLVGKMGEELKEGVWLEPIQA